MATTAQIERQFARELEAKSEAKSRLIARTKRAEDRSYASSTVYGKALVAACIENTAEIIGKTISKSLNGTAGVNAITAYRVKDADPQVLAVLAAKCCLDLFGKEITPAYGQLCERIGNAVHDELKITHLQVQAPNLYADIKRHFKHTTGTQQKAYNFSRYMKLKGVKWDNWARPDQFKVGAWLLDCIAQATQWLAPKLIQRSSRKREKVIVFSPEFLALKTQLLETAESFAVCQWPMLCEPNDWDGEQERGGGYLTSELRRTTTLVRARKSKGLGPCLKGTEALQMLNQLQKVAYRINTTVLDVANYCMEHRISIGKFRAEDPAPVPPMPQGELSPEEIKAWKIQATNIYDYNASLEQKNYRSAETLFVANKYRDDVFWVPHSFDYRGRIYPIVTSLSPQGTDFDKSLFYFESEGPANEWWLAFHCATTYGLDKASMEERVAWTRANTTMIEAIASDPLEYLSLWSKADEPWSFLAACLEYHACCISQHKGTSGLPVGIDATCSGLQHLAAMTLDGTAASMVNVTPTPKPSDGYAIVAEKAKDQLRPELHSWMNRKVTKRVCMCYSYGLSRHSARGYIRDALLEQGRDLSEKGLLTEITNAIYNYAVPQIFPGPSACMAFIQKAVKQAFENGAEELTYVTPSGFLFVQDLRESLTRRIKTQLMGTSLRTVVADGFGKPDVNHHISASAPNLVHALDSTLIHKVGKEWTNPIAVIHDCVLARSCDLDELGSLIRNKFVEIYSQPVLKQWAERIGVTIPDDLIKNTLDLESVKESKYFFC
jgi:DNA-directed RNA polymerase